MEQRYAACLRAFAEGRGQEAVDAALGMVKRDRDWNGQAARRLLLRMFDALGRGSQVARRGLRRLSNLLFM